MLHDRNLSKSMLLCDFFKKWAINKNIFEKGERKSKHGRRYVSILANRKTKQINWIQRKCKSLDQGQRDLHLRKDDTNIDMEINENGW